MSKKKEEEPPQKTFTELSEEIKGPLNKQFSERTQEDIDLLVQFANTVKYFKNNFGEQEQAEQLQLLCRVMKAQKVPAGRTLFRVGEEGSKFYLILNGKISLRVPDKIKIKEMVQILVLQAGQSFGETALYQKVEQSSTMVCVQDSYLLTIDRRDYEQQQIEWEIQKKKLEEEQQQQQQQQPDKKK